MTWQSSYSHLSYLYRRLQTKGSSRNQITRFFVKLHNIVTAYFTTHCMHENTQDGPKTQDVGSRPLFLCALWLKYFHVISGSFFTLCNQTMKLQHRSSSLYNIQMKQQNHTHLNVNRCNWMNTTLHSLSQINVDLRSFTYYLNINVACAYLKWKYISYFPFGAHWKTPTCRAPK